MKVETLVRIRITLRGEPEDHLALELFLTQQLEKCMELDEEAEIWVHIWGAGEWEFRRWAYAYGQHGNRMVEHFNKVMFVEHTNEDAKLARARGKMCADFAHSNYFYKTTKL